jgi:hypothetical protein
MPVKYNRFLHRLFILRRIVLSKMYRLLGPLNSKLQPNQLYCIKAGYHTAHMVENFDDRSNTDQWQSDVYKSAESYIKKIQGKSVIDVGCGSAFKFLNLFGTYDTIGIELTATYEWLLANHALKKWMDFENTDPARLHADMIICSDVIEHVKIPDELMDFLNRIDFKFLVLSTPERNRMRGKSDFGPPENTAHYREWNEPEFKEYVSKWFVVQEQIISNDKSVSQILFCTKKDKTLS